MSITLKNVETANQLIHLHELLQLEGSKSIAVAYVDRKGLALIRNQLEHTLASLRTGQTVRFFIDLHSGNTEPTAVNDLVALAKEYGVLQIRAFHPGRPQPRLHAKLFISHSDENGSVSFLTGSYNLTEAALQRNKEHGLLIEAAGEDAISKQTICEFERLWGDKINTIEVNERAAQNYLKGYRKGGDVQDRGQDPSVWNHYRDKEFVWPSEETAFLMGVICARGYFQERLRRIKISLEFHPRAWKGGDNRDRIKVGEVEHDPSIVLPEVRERIGEEVKSVLPYSTISTLNSLGLSVDCSKEEEAFGVIFQAFRRKEVRKGCLPLPTYIKTQPKNVVRKFIRGYATASALVGDKSRKSTNWPGYGRAGKRGAPRPYWVWLRPLLDSGIDEELMALIGRLKISPAPSKPRGVEILAEDFKHSIGFDIDWWQKLVDEAASLNQELKKQPALGNKMK